MQRFNRSGATSRGLHRRRTAALLALTAAALYVASGLAYRSVPGDDAFITFRYAANWLDGHGPVWNPGERVEGYSNPLFLVLLTALGATGVPIPGAADLLNVLGLAVVVGIAARWGREHGPGTAAIAVGLVLLHPSIALYLHEGLETVLHTALVVLALYLVRGEVMSPRRTAAAALAAAAIALSRPEGILLTAVIGMLCLVAPAPPASRQMRGAGTFAGGSAAPWRRAAIFVAVAGGVIGAGLALRLWFYGELVPNTAHIKLGEPLLERLAHGAQYVLRGGIPVVLAPLAALPLWPRATPRQRRSLVYLVAGIVSVTAFPIVSGGDWMRGHRFLVPALPLAALLWGAVFAASWQAWSRANALHRRAARLVGAVAVVALLAGLARGHTHLARAHNQDAAWVAAHEDLGRWLEAHTPPPTLVAIGAVGAAGYRSRRPVLDCWGINDAWIARSGKRAPELTLGHQAYDGEYVWRRRPHWVFPYNGPLERPLDEAAFRELTLAPPQLSRFWAAELMAQPGFDEAYSYHVIEVAPNVWFGGYARANGGATPATATRSS